MSKKTDDDLLPLLVLAALWFFKNILGGLPPIIVPDPRLKNKDKPKEPDPTQPDKTEPEPIIPAEPVPIDQPEVTPIPIIEPEPTPIYTEPEPTPVIIPDPTPTPQPYTTPSIDIPPPITPQPTPTIYVEPEPTPAQDPLRLPDIIFTVKDTPKPKYIPPPPSDKPVISPSPLTEISKPISIEPDEFKRLEDVGTALIIKQTAPIYTTGAALIAASAASPLLSKIAADVTSPLIVDIAKKTIPLLLR